MMVRSKPAIVIVISGVIDVLCTVWHTHTRKELQTVLSDSSKGDTLLGSPHLVDLTLSLLSLRVPHDWWELVGPSSPPLNWPLREWVQDLVLRFTFLDRLLTGGMAKTPTYWLGAFFNPQAFLSVVQQVSKYQSVSHLIDRSINQSVSKSLDRLINQSINQSIDRLINQSMNEW